MGNVIKHDDLYHFDTLFHPKLLNMYHFDTQNSKIRTFFSKMIIRQEINFIISLTKRYKMKSLQRAIHICKMMLSRAYVPSIGNSFYKMYDYEIYWDKSHECFRVMASDSISFVKFGYDNYIKIVVPELLY